MGDIDSGRVLKLRALRERFRVRIALFMSGNPRLFPKQWRGLTMDKVTALHRNLSRRIEIAKAAGG